RFRRIPGASLINTNAARATPVISTSGVSAPTARRVATARTPTWRRGRSNEARLHPRRARGDALRPCLGRGRGRALHRARRGHGADPGRSGGRRHLPAGGEGEGHHPQPDLRGAREARGEPCRAADRRRGFRDEATGGWRARHGRATVRARDQLPAPGPHERRPTARRDAGTPGVSDHSGCVDRTRLHSASGPMTRRESAGFTLLEVLVAMVILSVAVVTLIQLASQGLRLLKL